MKEQVTIVKTTSENPDFLKLIKALDDSLWGTYPELKADYWGNNNIEFNPNVVLVYYNEEAVACCCFKKYDQNTIEIKRMFVDQVMRGKGIASQMLQELESWAKDLGYSISVLETLHKQTAAIEMYQKVGYSIVENYPPYEGLANSICMRKNI
ncbi:GNAT family N-acetyltransferase [Flavobacterium polysaccharolyticum]|uniref:GNAT family N-acetyltransferase n=1 Tax=Flavobacterium polysaccharolyticum TaxID=3133148 RepID=A0ABU9NJ44_9FLAO